MSTAESAKLSTPAGTKAEVDTSDIMKRNAARKLIERYYYQLTSGCGEVDCDNNFCASSQSFCLLGLDSNAAAAKALELFKNRSRLCDERSTKLAKSSTGDAAESANVVLSSVDSATAEEKPGTSGVTTSVEGLFSKPAASVATVQSKHVEYLTERRLHEVIEYCRQIGSWSQLLQVIGQVFFDPESLMRSFLVASSDDILPLSKEEMHAMELDQDKEFDEQELKRLETNEDSDDESETPGGNSVSSSSPVASNISIAALHWKSEISSRATQQHIERIGLLESYTSVDITSLRRGFTELFAIPNLPFQSALVTAVIYLSRTLDADLRSANLFSCRPEYSNLFVIIMEIPALDSLEFLEEAMPQFCKTVGLLPVNVQARLALVWSCFSSDHLRHMVSCVQQLITVRVVTHWPQNTLVHDDNCITGAARLLKILYYASIAGGKLDTTEVVAAEMAAETAAEDRSEAASFRDVLEPEGDMRGTAGGHERKERLPQWEDPLGHELGIRPMNCRQPLVAVDNFVNESLSEVIEMEKEYMFYRAIMSADAGATTASNKFSFMMHPFLLTTAVKNLGMFFDNRIRMFSERRSSVLQNIVYGAQVETRYLRLRIRRDHIIDDSLINLEMVAMDNPHDLKKQLFVEFEGEQGIDEGGVSKEFFQLVIEELFNPDIGMFTVIEETETFWFNPSSFENDGQFMLIGIVLGLAIYNNVILDVHFPMVVYRKLMGKLGTFEDLKISHPRLAQGLQGLLDYDGDVAEAFMQPFSIGFVDMFGVPQVHDLKENGNEITVTNETRHEFVELYADFLLNKSVEKQFSAFQRGFLMVTNESPLRMLFRPDEVEMLICGSKNFDFKALEEAAGYDGGYTAESPTIRYFWETVHELSEKQKRLLLQFTTGSDRVPIGGLAKLKLIIARNGPDSDRLPTSHTCFNVLLLPDYSSKDKLAEHLLKAITNCKGFGML